MFCTKCGTSLPTGAGFCTKCGTKVADAVNNPSTNTPNHAPNTNTGIPSTPSNASNLIIGLHKQRVAILAASVIGTLSMFLPWATSIFWDGTVTWNAFQFEIGAIGGFAVLLFFGIPIAMALLGNRSKELTVKRRNWCIWDGVVGVIYGIWFITHINGLPWETQLREGLFLMMLTSAAVAASAFLLGSRSKA